MRRENEPKRHSGEWRKHLKKANSSAKREAKQRQKKLKGFLRRGCRPPACLHCDSEGELVAGSILEPTRTNVADKWFYVCPACKDSRVGCHGTSQTPMGMMANRETRLARRDTHTAFDAAWSRLGLTRFAAYRILASQMGLAAEHCHIANFTVDQCQQVVQICDGK